MIPLDEDAALLARVSDTSPQGPAFWKAVQECFDALRDRSAAIRRVEALCDQGDRDATMSNTENGKLEGFWTDEVRAALLGSETK